MTYKYNPPAGGTDEQMARLVAALDAPALDEDALLLAARDKEQE